MAHIGQATTKRSKDAKPQPAYRVRWTETERDQMGRGIPYNPARPEGQKRQRSRQESYASREAAQERCDELNAARHFDSAQSASEIRKAGDESRGALGEIRTSSSVPAPQYHVMPEYAFDKPKDGSKLLRRASRYSRILGRRDHVRDHGRDLKNCPV